MLLIFCGDINETMNMPDDTTAAMQARRVSAQAAFVFPKFSSTHILTSSR
jgi:hypothetical protein